LTTPALSPKTGRSEAVTDSVIRRMSSAVRSQSDVVPTRISSNESPVLAAAALQTRKGESQKSEGA
jgi:hypothetical protein